MDLMSVMYRIWSLFIKNVTFTKAKKSTSARHQSITKTLMGFIKAHYHENFAITDLAAFTSYSGSECCRIFKKRSTKQFTSSSINIALKKPQSSCEIQSFL
ncbi:MAG: hypothetical protein ACLVLA_12200 [Acidaminococcus intestini]